MKAIKSIKSAVLGCTGLVGQQFINLLGRHPYFELKAIFASHQSAGRYFGEAVDWAIGGDIPEPVKKMKIQETSIANVLKQKVDILFSALPAAAARSIEGELREKGKVIFSNTGAYRMEKDVPILMPEVNPEHLALVESQKAKYGGFIVTNSNCSTAGLVMVLKPLLGFGIRAVQVSTFQSVSGGGRRGLAAMEILGNVIPFIKNEEDKMERETLKILGSSRGGCVVEPADFQINASCCRVPVQYGHLEIVGVELKELVQKDILSEVLATFEGIPQELSLPSAPQRPIILTRRPDRPQPLLDAYAGSPERARGMTVTVGRLRQRGNSLRLFCLVHNTIRGAAGTSVLNAELAVRQGFIRTG